MARAGTVPDRAWDGTASVDTAGSSSGARSSTSTTRSDHAASRRHRVLHRSRWIGSARRPRARRGTVRPGTDGDRAIARAEAAAGAARLPAARSQDRFADEARSAILTQLVGSSAGAHRPVPPRSDIDRAADAYVQHRLGRGSTGSGWSRPNRRRQTWGPRGVPVLDLAATSRGRLRAIWRRGAEIRRRVPLRLDWALASRRGWAIPRWRDGSSSSRTPRPCRRSGRSSVPRRCAIRPSARKRSRGLRPDTPRTGISGPLLYGALGDGTVQSDPDRARPRGCSPTPTC